MKNLKFLILLLITAFYSCERDDICNENTPTTPQLVIAFFDNTERETLKSVIRLSAYGESLFLDENAMLIPPIESNRRSIVFNSAQGLTRLKLPLILGTEGVETTTRYVFEKDTNLRIDADTATNSNRDIIEIKYIPKLVYVSRACGFKSIFTGLKVTIIPDGANWLQNFEYANTSEDFITVENENQTHVQLFH